MLCVGLILAGFHISRQERVERGTNLRRFKSFYGSSPFWSVQKSGKIFLPPTFLRRVLNLCQEHLTTFSCLFTFWRCTQRRRNWLASRRCVKRQQGSGFGFMLPRYKPWRWRRYEEVQVLGCRFVKKELTFELPPLKIVWPEEWASAAYSSAIFLYSVDGVHCRTNEILHPTLAKNTKLYSHKFNQAGFGYELALSLTSSSLVWINGPFLGSKHDVTIFRDNGLKNTTAAGKKGIADQGYRGEKGILCTLSSHDSGELRTFKVLSIRTNTNHVIPLLWHTAHGCTTSHAYTIFCFNQQSRARARHETFNSRIKNFGCLEQRFRHGMEKHRICFEAVCVIVQYQMDNGAPLFDV